MISHFGDATLLWRPFNGGVLPTMVLARQSVLGVSAIAIADGCGMWLETDAGANCCQHGEACQRLLVAPSAGSMLIGCR